MVTAWRLVKKLRGGAQAHLIEASDGACYVVKFLNNPQHRRTLINEWVAGVFLKHLQVYSPEQCVIEIPATFIAENPELYIALGSRRDPPLAGLHYGSKVAVNPQHVAIYDFLPDVLFKGIKNRRDFLGALVFDKWIGNADSRQAIFFRSGSRTQLKTEGVADGGLLTQMIDHGFAFNGPHWNFRDSPADGVYFRHSVYDEAVSLDSFQPWLDMVAHFPYEIVNGARKAIPETWTDGDEMELDKLLDRLLKRRTRVDELILEVKRERSSVFRNWG